MYVYTRYVSEQPSAGRDFALRYLSPDYFTSARDISKEIIPVSSFRLRDHAERGNLVAEEKLKLYRR